MTERLETLGEKPEGTQPPSEQFEKIVELEAFKRQCPYWQECVRAKEILAGELEPIECGGVTEQTCVRAYLKHFTGNEADYP